MTAFPTLKNNYYIRRLAPFLIVYLVYELIEVAILAFLQQTGTDWNSLTLLRLLGNLLVETCSSFLYLIIPYLLYLAALPKAFHGGKTDHVLTTAFFTLFCLLNCCEEMAEILTREHFSFYSRQFLQSPGHAWAQIAEGVPIIPALLAVLTISTATVVLFSKKLVPLQPPPSAPVRASAPVLACAMAFILSWGSSGPLPAYGGENGEIAKDGLFSFFGDLFAVTTLPHLPSIFGIPVLITGSIILLFLLAEYIPERFMSATLRPSFLAGNLFRRMKNVSTSVPILHSGSFYSWQRYFSSASSAWEPTPSWTRRKHAMPKCPGKCWKQTSGSSPSSTTAFPFGASPLSPFGQALSP